MLKKNTKKLMFMSLMVAYSLILYLIESTLPGLYFIAPGAKLGLSNIVSVTLLYIGGIQMAFSVLIVRIILSSIFGGGSINAKMGEVALSNNGILFFDELPHFPSNILEALREPLEDNKILISRVNSKVLYSTKFLFVAAMNPCPCGNKLSSVKECRCNSLEVQRYKNRLSEPFLDRIDLYLVMNDSFNDNKNIVSSSELHQSVIKAFIKFLQV